jgi:hypothetical protein
MDVKDAAIHCNQQIPITDDFKKDLETDAVQIVSFELSQSVCYKILTAALIPLSIITNRCMHTGHPTAGKDTKRYKDDLEDLVNRRTYWYKTNTDLGVIPWGQLFPSFTGVLVQMIIKETLIYVSSCCIRKLHTRKSPCQTLPGSLLSIEPPRLDRREDELQRVTCKQHTDGMKLTSVDQLRFAYVPRLETHY